MAAICSYIHYLMEEVFGIRLPSVVSLLVSWMHYTTNNTWVHHLPTCFWQHLYTTFQPQPHLYSTTACLCLYITFNIMMAALLYCLHQHHLGTPQHDHHHLATPLDCHLLTTPLHHHHHYLFTSLYHLQHHHLHQ